MNETNRFFICWFINGWECRSQWKIFFISSVLFQWDRRYKVGHDFNSCFIKFLCTWMIFYPLKKMGRVYWCFEFMLSHINLNHIFSCDQAALWMVRSVRLAVCLSVYLAVCLSVCLSVRPSFCLSVTPFWLCSHHRIIMKFSGVITNDRSDVHAKG